jgi:mevalonate kinase
MDSFNYHIPGKWILAGEHSVLRGCEAIVFPITSRYLNFKYISSKQAFSIVLVGENSSDLEMIIWSVFEKAMNEIKIKRSDLTGELTITSHIAFGAGMGASATLAVGIAEFFKRIQILKTDLFQFAKKIEDLFHGESSGVDVAVALYQKPLIYKRGSEIKLLDSVKLPNLYLSHCGVRGVTKDCVTKVKSYFESDPKSAAAIDLRMSESVEAFKYLLSVTDSEKIDLLSWIKAIRLSQSCFESWGLVPVEAQQHIDFLKNSGALAIKMTGSGGGGYVLSLWDELPAPELEKVLIKV